MEWYYAEGETRVGPLTDADFAAAVRQGKVTTATLVWNANLENWTPYGRVVALAEAAAGLAPRSDQDREVGPEPQFNPVVAAATGETVYAGFWIRVAATFLDSLILNIVAGAGQVLVDRLAAAVGASGTAAGQVATFSLTAGFVLVSLVVTVGYHTWMVGRFGSTLGKMACRIRIVRPGGEQVTYLRAFGRFFAEFLSALLLGIGYIMAAFDSEKRALHDIICDTRVVYYR